MEDQVRRMILAGGDTTGRHENAVLGARPVVRLPPLTAPQPSGVGNFAAGNSYDQTSLHDVPTERSSFVPPHYRQGLAHDLPAGIDHLPPQHRQGQLHGIPPSRGMAVHPQASYPSQPPAMPPHIRAAQRDGQRMQLPLDPNAFNRSGYGDRGGSHQQQYQPQRPLFDPAGRSSQRPPSYGGSQARSYNEHHMRQSEYLDEVATLEIPVAEMTQAERVEKDSFRLGLQKIISNLCETDPERFPRISLQCFGSFQSGFASRGSDMDLAIVSEDPSRASACFSLMEQDLPRTLEKRLLELGYGARLLTRTRVPIIKICEKPGPELLSNLREERDKWDPLSDEKKYPHLHDEDEVDLALSTTKSGEIAQSVLANDAATIKTESAVPVETSAPNAPDDHLAESQAVPFTVAKSTDIQAADKQAARQRRDQKWTRERKSGPLDFPKDGIGIQSDINFFNPLGLHNTQMLRNYSLCDPRVRPIVLFVKAWAKRRKINSAYSGTLSSYGYVLMVLHYLINVAHPAVLPNLQSVWRPNPQCTPPGATRTEVDNWVVDFWRSEAEITTALEQGQMSYNTETVGSLLVGFFSYFSSTGGGPQFHWMKDVLALRTPSGILSKDEKGWVKAVTEESEGRKVQQRYLFCIEDPFELSHNVSRTVTHYGIVAIRDEFRRAKRVLMSVANGMPSKDGMLMDALVEEEGLEKAMESHNLHRSQEPGRPTSSDAGPSVNRSSPSTLQPQSRNASIQQGRNGGPARFTRQPTQAQNALNVMDNTAFPSLGGAMPATPSATVRKPQNSPRAPHARKKKLQYTSKSDVRDDRNTGEISGVRAKEYLAEVRRKNAEAAAELVAKGAAEAVLGGED